MASENSRNVSSGSCEAGPSAEVSMNQQRRAGILRQYFGYFLHTTGNSQASSMSSYAFPQPLDLEIAQAVLSSTNSPPSSEQLQQAQEPEASQPDANNRTSGLRMFLQAIRRYNISLAALITWGIGLFVLVQLNESYVMTPFVISFACLSAWLMTKLAQYYHRGMSQQHAEEEQTGQNNEESEPPPYEIVISKPPPYDQLFCIAPASSPRHSCISIETPPSSGCQRPSGVEDTSVANHKTDASEGVSFPHQDSSDGQEEEDEDDSLPSYEQALTMLSSSSSTLPTL